MQTGKIDCTHDFYLKFFHLLLANNSITYDPFDFIFIDEAGDLNEVTLAIFLLLPAKRKVATGDRFQNIYQFNHTINCFTVLAEQGTIFRLTKSFRVAPHIATKIDTFCKKYLRQDMIFKGTKPKDNKINSRAYLTRTNAALIAKMIDLNAAGVPYGLLRKASEIFKLPLILCNLKPGHFIYDPAYKHLQEDVDLWGEDEELQEKYQSPLAYIASIYSKDFQLTQAIRLIMRHSRNTIISTFNEAKNHERKKHNYTLATVHSCKGLERDEITIADDLNNSIEDIAEDIENGKTIEDLSEKEVEALNLYYVACTRAAKVLNNAKWL